MSINKISICATAYRPQNWLRLYKSLGQNLIDFELIFVGPNKPKYVLPSNFKFILSNVKPAQCYEIALRNSSGNFILHVADDLEFLSPNPLDKLYEAYDNSISKDIIVTPTLYENGVCLRHAHYYDVNDLNSPSLPSASFFSKHLYNKLGGVDKNFIAVMFDIDIAMRLYEIGGKIILTDVIYNEDKKTSSGSDLCGEYWNHDRGYLDKLWMENGKITKNRKYRVELFLDSRISEVSQGPRGRWRGSESKLINIVQDRVGDTYTIYKRIYRAIASPKLYIYHLKKLYKKNRN